jgi:hypothetical protein
LVACEPEPRGAPLLLNDPVPGDHEART